MVETLQAFVLLLRKNGVPVGTAEFLCALSALRITGLLDPQATKLALRTCLTKRPIDQSRFDDLFDLFFCREGEILKAGADAPLPAALSKLGLSEEQLEAVLARLSSVAARLDPTARLGLGLRTAGLALLLRLSGLKLDVSQMQSPLQIGFFTQRFLEQLGFRQAETELRAALGALELPRQWDEQLKQNVLQTMLHAAEQNLLRLRQGVRSEVQRAFEKQSLSYAEKARTDLLWEKPLSQLSKTDLAQLQKEVARLADKLKSKKKAKTGRNRGRLFVRQTLRAALQTDGIPFRLRFKYKKPHKPKLVLLCDISDSVRSVARFMLQFAYTVQARFAKVRTFVFVSDLGEATEFFEHTDIDRAVQKVYSGAVVSVAANSNYGRALTQFARQHLETVTTRTTVIILGDGRSNYFPPEAWALCRIKERAKQVLWLNPEMQSSWNFGDSAMRDYLPHVTRAQVVYNLMSLRRVMDEWMIE